MNLRSLRGFVFDRLVRNLALLLGGMQALVAGWLTTVAGGIGGPGLAAWCGLSVLLVAGNALLVPAMRRGRMRDDWRGVLARFYMELGVATILVGTVLAIVGLAFLPLSATIGLLGIDAPAVSAAFRWLSVLLAGTTAALVLWGYTVGQALVDRTHLRVPIPKLHEDLAGLRIVQISDLHIGNRLEDERLIRVVEQTNALDPDIVAITGDIFDFDPSHVEEGARLLGGLRARFGVYAVLGNHDTYTGADLVADALRRNAPRLRVLRDEIEKIPVSEPLYVAGIEDPGRNWSSRGLELETLSSVARSRPDDGPVLLLVHRPQAFGQAERLGFPLVLAGHTHGGQLALPIPGGQYNLASIISPYTRGIYRRNGTTMYVNRGIGVAGPRCRINCSREIATIELVVG